MLSRRECLELLELPEKADSYEIENRYNMLIKRYHSQNDGDSIRMLDEITTAYNILTGRYVEPKPLDPRLEKVVFGKSRYQWKNLWHYGRMTLLAVVLVAAFVIYMIYSIVTNTSADFQIVSIGAFYATDDAEERIQTFVIDTVLPAAEKVEYQSLPITFDDPEAEAAETTEGTDSALDVSANVSTDAQSQYAYTMKLMALISAEDIDVYFCSKPAFNTYAVQGIFVDLTPLYEKLQDLPADVLAKIKPLRRELADDTDETTVATDASGEILANGGLSLEEWRAHEAEMNSDTSLPIYGLDVSELELGQGLGLYGDTQVLTIGFKTKDEAITMDFFEEWIRSYDLMKQQRLVYESNLNK